MHKDNPADRAFQRQAAARQPQEDAKEMFAESEAQIKRQASEQPDPGNSLTDEERKKLLEESAEKSFKEIGEKKSGGSQASE